MTLELLDRLQFAVARHDVQLFATWKQEPVMQKNRDHLLGPTVTVWVGGEPVTGRVMGPTTFMRQVEFRSREASEVPFPCFDPATWCNPDSTIAIVEKMVLSAEPIPEFPDSLYLLVVTEAEPPTDESTPKSRNLPFPLKNYQECEIPFSHIQRWSYVGQ